MTTPRLFQHPNRVSPPCPASYAVFEMTSNPNFRGLQHVLEAMFDVLTESQQERILQACGWQLLPQPKPQPPKES